MTAPRPSGEELRLFQGEATRNQRTGPAPGVLARTIEFRIPRFGGGARTYTATGVPGYEATRGAALLVGFLEGDPDRPVVVRPL